MSRRARPYCFSAMRSTSFLSSTGIRRPACASSGLEPEPNQELEKVTYDELSSHIQDQVDAMIAQMDLMFKDSGRADWFQIFAYKMRQALDQHTKAFPHAEAFSKEGNI